MTEISQKYPRHRHCSTYDTALRAVLSRYLSAITVETILSGVYDDENLDPSKMTRQDLERIFQSSLFLSVRTFCVSNRLADAMIDLAELLERLPDVAENE